MALGRPKAYPPPLRLFRGAAEHRLIVYREGLLLAPRSASRRADRGVPGAAPSAIRLDAFRRMVDAELSGQVAVARPRRGVLCLSSDANVSALQRALRFARMLGLSGWESRAGSFARLCEPSAGDLGTLLEWLLTGETARVTLVRGRDVLEIAANTKHLVALAERVADDCYSAARWVAGRPSRSLRPEEAERAVARWARAVRSTVSLDVWLAPPVPRRATRPPESGPPRHAP